MNEHKFDRQRLLELAELHCLDELDEACREELEAILLDNPRACALFGNYVQMHANLEERLAAEHGSESLLASTSVRDQWIARPLRNVVQFFARPTPFSVTVAALVIGLMVTTMALLAPPTFWMVTGGGGESPQSTMIVGELTGLHRPVWAEGEAFIYPGAQLAAGRRLELREGLAEITFLSGAVVLLEGPAQFELRTGKSALLHGGRITARVGESARGFVIEAPEATVTDWGTEFGVAATNDRTAVYVFSGSVEVAPKPGLAQESGPRQLVAGESVTYSRSGTAIVAQSRQEESFRRVLPGRRGIVDLTPNYVAGVNYSRIMAGEGQAMQDAGLHNYDEAVPVSAALARNQYIWLDLSSALDQLKGKRVEKVLLRWSGLIKTRVDHTQQSTVASKLGVFPVPDNQRGINTVFSAGDGNDNVRFYQAHVDELVASVSVPQVQQPQSFHASWNITELVVHWLKHPEDPRRGQLIIINGQHPMWVSWESKPPRLLAEVGAEDSAVP